MARGHQITIFTRGRRDADLPAGVVRLTGDRNGRLDARSGGNWDAVTPRADETVAVHSDPIDAKDGLSGFLSPERFLHRDGGMTWSNGSTSARVLQFPPRSS
jgi:2'-hydroxyisoflavone reductase